MDRQMDTRYIDSDSRITRIAVKAGPVSDSLDRDSVVDELDCGQESVSLRSDFKRVGVTIWNR